MVLGEQLSHRTLCAPIAAFPGPARATATIYTLNLIRYNWAGNSASYHEDVIGMNKYTMDLRRWGQDMVQLVETGSSAGLPVSDIFRGN